MQEISRESLEKFRVLLRKACEIDLGPEKAYLFNTRLSSLLVQSGCSSFEELHAHIEKSYDTALLDKVIDAMTTQETNWFRDTAYWDEIANVILPDIASRALKERRKTFIWSAACSTGQEPYSIAMLAMEEAKLKTAFGLSVNDIMIVATDVSPAALTLAKAGKYGRIAIHRGKLGERKDKYFTQEGNVWTICPQARKLVHFQRFNLKDPIPSVEHYDLVLCRNVMVYFSQEFRRLLLERLYRAIRPGGYLILGACEGIYGDCDKFTLVKGDKCIYYRR